MDMGKGKDSYDKRKDEENGTNGLGLKLYRSRRRETKSTRTIKAK
jgi:hypothetical protein